MVAIGDGGNDVSMIQAANVGIGIEGKVCDHVEVFFGNYMQICICVICE